MTAQSVSKAIILTAGEGAHFYPLTVTRPKGMSIVAGKPILQHTVEALVEAGIKECWFVVGYKPERLRTFFGNGKNFGMSAHYVEQASPEGTGAAILLAAKQLDPSEEVLVVFGDNRYTSDLVRTVTSIRGDVVLGTGNADPRRNGLLVAKSGKLSTYEYPSTSERGLVNTGLMKFTPSFFKFLMDLSSAESAQLPHALSKFVEAGNAVQVAIADQGWDEADSVWELLRLNEHLLQAQQDGKVPVVPGVRIEGSVSIGKNTRIQPGAQIIGPVAIGTDCEIQENAVIGPYVSLRNGVHIGAATEVRHAIINNNVFVDSQCIVRFSIIDDGVRIGPFGILAEGEAQNGDQSLPSRRGAVIGPDSRLGSRVTVKPGSVLGEEAVVADGLVVGGLESRARRV